MSALRALHLQRLVDPTPCGSLWIDLNGTACALRCSAPCGCRSSGRWSPPTCTWRRASAYAARGQLLPPYDTADTLARLEAEVAALDPDILVLLGDSFHDAGALDRLAPRYALRLAALALGRTLVWAEGKPRPRPAGGRRPPAAGGGGRRGAAGDPGPAS